MSSEISTIYKRIIRKKPVTAFPTITGSYFTFFYFFAIFAVPLPFPSVFHAL